MIRVRVELWSAITGAVTELARMDISNDGQEANPNFGNYNAYTAVGRTKEQLDKARTSKSARIVHWPRKAKHVWNLVQHALTEMGYGK